MFFWNIIESQAQTDRRDAYETNIEFASNPDNGGEFPAAFVVRRRDGRDDYATGDNYADGTQSAESTDTSASTTTSNEAPVVVEATPEPAAQEPASQGTT